MTKTEAFFRAMAWFCLGALLGFLLAPIKRGVDIAICSNNTGAEDYAFLGAQDEDDE